MILPNASTSFSQHIQIAIDRTIAEQVAKEQEIFIAQAVKDYEQKLRAEIGNIAIKFTEWYSMQVDGNKITLQILIDKHTGEK